MTVVDLILSKSRAGSGSVVDLIKAIRAEERLQHMVLAVYPDRPGTQEISGGIAVTIPTGDISVEDVSSDTPYIDTSVSFDSYDTSVEIITQ